MDLNTRKKLNNGVEMPIFGLGVYKSADGEETYNAVRWALANPEMSRIERMILASPRYQHGRYCEQKRQAAHVDKILREGVEKGELRRMPPQLMGEIFFGIGRALLDHMNEHPEDVDDQALWAQCFDSIRGCLGTPA